MDLGGCSKLCPLLEQIFAGGNRSGFVCTGGGGDFVVGDTESQLGITCFYFMCMNGH